MTPEQISLVQTSFQKILPIKDRAAEIFYSHLFELDPTLKSIFPSDLTDQRKKLMAALATMVSGLSQPELIMPTIKELGARHIDYGTGPHHFTTVGETLIWTLSQGLGDAFTDPVREAWIETYAMLSSVMIEAAEKARAA